MKLKFTIGFLNILVAAIIVGTLIFVRITFNPTGCNYATYLSRQQLLLEGLGKLMIPLAPIIIILTLVSVYLEKNRNLRMILLLAAIFIILNTIISAFGNVPINNIVMTWNLQNIPENWQKLRDQWWFFNNIRLISATAALCLIIWANTSNNLLRSI